MSMTLKRLTRKNALAFTFEQSACMQFFGLIRRTVHSSNLSSHAITFKEYTSNLIRAIGIRAIGIRAMLFEQSENCHSMNRIFGRYVLLKKMGRLSSKPIVYLMHSSTFGHQQFFRLTRKILMVNSSIGVYFILI